MILYSPLSTQQYSDSIVAVSVTAQKDMKSKSVLHDNVLDGFIVTLNLCTVVESYNAIVIHGLLTTRQHLK